MRTSGRCQVQRSPCARVSRVTSPESRRLSCCDGKASNWADLSVRQGGGCASASDDVLCEVARGELSGADLADLGLLLGADVLRERTAGPEPAAARRIEWRGRVTGQATPLDQLIGVRLGHRFEQC